MIDYLPYLLTATKLELISSSRQYFHEHMMLLLAILGYIHVKRTYMNSVVPVVIPISIDLDKCVIKVKNTGKWHAQFIQTPRYSHFIDFGKGVGFREWHLDFENPAFLEPGSEADLKTIGYENGQKVSSKPDMMFLAQIPSEYSPKDKKGRKLRAKFPIEYRDIEGRSYITRATIVEGRFTDIVVSRDYWRFIRIPAGFLKYWFVKYKCKLIEKIRGS